MADEPRESPSPAISFQNSPSSGPSGLRYRGISRAATFAEGTGPAPNLRRNSTLSDTVSEARHSIRSSTDDLFLPRVSHTGPDDDLPTEESHWHSAPLLLALSPAIAGVFFQNGSAVVTDVTLLVLAAIFLNWSVRLPWYDSNRQGLFCCLLQTALTYILRGWYRSAQAVRRQASEEFAVETVIAESETEGDGSGNDAESESKPANDASPRNQQRATAASSASKELQIHELVALLSCFIFPMIGAWLLHAIRSKLSRPSEGLVSNYNLTIFILAAEIRPFSHLLKMVQARTLHLQRVVASAAIADSEAADADKLQDLSKRLEELEAHIASAAATRTSPTPSSPSSAAGGGSNARDLDSDTRQAIIASTTAQVRRSLQPEIDALTRAVRRYEKRTAVTTFQTDNHLHELSIQVHDALALAGAAQRSTTRRRPSFALILLDWICAIIVIPTQLLLAILSLPARTASWCVNALRVLVLERSGTGRWRRSPSTTKLRKSTKGKSAQRAAAAAAAAAGDFPPPILQGSIPASTSTSTSTSGSRRFGKNAEISLSSPPAPPPPPSLAATPAASSALKQQQQQQQHAKKNAIYDIYE